jgi:hypothetical protein
MQTYRIALVIKFFGQKSYPGNEKYYLFLKSAIARIPP